MKEVKVGQVWEFVNRANSDEYSEFDCKWTVDRIGEVCPKCGKCAIWLTNDADGGAIIIEKQVLLGGKVMRLVKEAE